MSLCLSSIDKEEKRINASINRQLKKDKLKAKNTVKLLLLGTGECGKSTFIKQMRVIHGSGYTEPERKEFISLIHKNLIMAMQCMTQAMPIIGGSYDQDENVKHALLIESLEIDNIYLLTPNHFDALESLWHDNGLICVYEKRNLYYLTDSAKHYLDKIAEIRLSDYLPSIQDVLRVRVPTTGIIEYPFTIQKTLFQMVDVGGQRSERKKWIHCFENVTSVIFVAALNEYDQILRECEHTNRMEESKNLFQVILKYQWFQESSFILFLNKKDILEEKIKNSHLSIHYPEFTGTNGCSAGAQEFILKMYTDLNDNPDRIIYSHFTCATDTENINRVFVAVKDTILSKMMNDFNMA